MAAVVLALAVLLPLPVSAQPTIGGGPGLQAGGPYMSIESGFWRAKATPGTELAPTIGAAGWTGGAPWDLTTTPGSALKASAGTGTLAPTVSLAPTAGLTYPIEIAATATAGSISSTFGGFTQCWYASATATTCASTISASGTYYSWTTAASNANLVITPTDAFRGTITSISVTAYAAGTGGLEVQGPFVARSPARFDAQVVVRDGLSSDPAIRSVSDSDSGINFVNGQIRFSQDGLAIGGVLNGEFFVSALDIGGSGDVKLYRDSPGVMQVGSDAATASAQALKGSDSTGNAAAGGNITLRGGAGTGTGNPVGGNLMLGGGAPNGTGERGVVMLLDDGTKPTCAVGIRGAIWYDAGAGGAADTLEVCAKSAADAYAWIAFATPIP